MTGSILEARHLSKSFGKVHAVRSVDFSLTKGSAFGLVGESGSGKSTVARLVLRLIEASSGIVRFEGEDLGSLGGEALRRKRRRMQMIFQDPYGSLNARMTVGETLAEPQLVHGIGENAEARRERARDLLREVGLPDSAMERFPHEFSGGQRQRVAIARALATDPELIVADEPVSALDVSVQAQILNLLGDMQKERRTTMLFISHDLRVVRYVCDEIAVMYLGEIVERGPREKVYAAPAHPYTKALLASAPGSPRRDGRRAQLDGEIPSAHAIPTGCAFRSRCAQAFDPCRTHAPRMRNVGGGQSASCHLLDR